MLSYVSGININSILNNRIHVSDRNFSCPGCFFHTICSLLFGLLLPTFFFYSLCELFNPFFPVVYDTVWDCETQTAHSVCRFMTASQNTQQHNECGKRLKEKTASIATFS